jgi:hypothetical protein
MAGASRQRDSLRLHNVIFLINTPRGIQGPAADVSRLPEVTSVSEPFYSIVPRRSASPAKCRAVAPTRRVACQITSESRREGSLPSLSSRQLSRRFVPTRDRAYFP